MNDAVCVDVIGDLDLRNAARCRRNAVELEDTQSFVVLCKFALAL